MSAMAGVEGQFAGSELILQQADTRAFVDGREVGSGTLRVEESNLCWSNGNEREKSLCLSYPSISIHAISTDTSSFPHKCIYLMYCPPREGEEEGEMEVEEEEEEEGQLMEIRLVPPTAELLQPIYQAITHCQTLYPDLEVSEEEEGEEEGRERDYWEREEVEGGVVEREVDLHSGEFFTSAEGLEHLSAQGQATLAHLERVIQLPSPQEFQNLVANGDGNEAHEAEPSQAQFEDAD